MNIRLEELDYIYNYNPFRDEKGRFDFGKIDSLSIEQIQSFRRSLYKNPKEYQKANNFLKAIIGSGGSIYQKAKDLNFNPEKEIKLSKALMGKNSIEVYRGQDNEFDDSYKTDSRWSEDRDVAKEKGNIVYMSYANKKTVLIHPKVLYSSYDNYDKKMTEHFASWEKEYVLDVKKKDVHIVSYKF